MALARRAQFGMAFTETDDPGIEMNPDGSLEVIATDGSRSSLPAGGASFPDEWTVGPDGQLLIAMTADVAPLTLRGSAGQTQPLLYATDSSENETVYLGTDGMRLRTQDSSTSTVFSAQSSDGTSAFEASGDGSGGVDTILMEATTMDFAAADTIFLGPDNSGASGIVTLHANILAGSTETFQTMKRNSAPPDGNLGNGAWTFWLDATPGATKLKIKAKDSGGTVRTGEVALT